MPLDRNYVIVAAFVGFIAWALLTDWLPSLRWIPYAFIAGVLTTLGGLLWLVGSTSYGVHIGERDEQHEYKPAPGFLAKEIWEEEKARMKARAEYRRPTIFPEAAAFSIAVDGLLDLILRDYVTSWYGNISPRSLFQNEVDRCIRSVLLTTAARFTDLDVVEIGVARILPLVTAHLKEFYDAEHTVRGKGLSEIVTESDELDVAIAGKYKAGRLHTVASLTHTDIVSNQQSHLRALVVKILPIVLPDNIKSSPASLVLIRELVTCAVFAPIVTMLQDPDFWNQLIVNFGGPMLEDRKSVRRVRAALDQHAPTSPQTARGSHFPRLRPYDGERQFERFIRAIRHVSTLSDARRFRSEIMSQIRRDSAIESQDAVYLRRLDTGKRLLDQKISALSASGGARPTLSTQHPASNGESTSRKRRASLREVIYHASGLSYFMEYMDRLKLMRLVQFYLVVDGFRNPLEGDIDEASGHAAGDAERMDMAQMYEAYLSQPELQTSEDALQAVRRYAEAGPEPRTEDYIAARRAVLQTQTKVFNAMNTTHFENFKRSDLYYKWLAIDDIPAAAAVQNKQVGYTSSPSSATGSDASPSKARHPPLPALSKSSAIRRTALSSTDLKGATQATATRADARHSLDEGSRPALFDDDVQDEPMMQSTPSLSNYDSDTENAQHARDEAKAVADMQLALNDIVGEDKKQASLFMDKPNTQSVDSVLSRPSVELERPALVAKSSSGVGKPSIASLGLVGAPRSRGVFVDDLFGDEAEKFAEDDRLDSDTPELSDEDRVQEAAPGDLGLIEAIDALNSTIEKLNAQKSVLDSLTAKAELTNNTAELRILRKSENSLQREIHRKEMQKQQYVVQESDNSLYGRAAVSIKSVMVGREDDGHEYALYVIEIRRQAGDQMPAATWAVTRRYSQFHELHKRLRTRFPAVGDLNFPRRQTLFTLQKDFIQKRRVTLERYLKSLLLVPAICRSRELRAFLSQSAISSHGASGVQVDTKDFVTRIYNSVSDGMEEFLGNFPVLDQLSVAGQNLISAATAQMNEGITGPSIDGLDPTTHDPATAAEAEAELNSYEAKEAEPFVTPICDLFLETFELSKGNSWLRGRTVVVILHQLLGSTIERKVRESANHAFEDENLAKYTDMLKNIVWPDGKPRPANVPRSPAERAKMRKEASVLLGALIPDLAGSVVGKAKAQAASRKIVAMMNNRKLNTHLVFTLIDEVVRIIFPEIRDK